MYILKQTKTTGIRTLSVKKSKYKSLVLSQAELCGYKSFDMALFGGIALLCRYGKVQTIYCLPYVKAKPFPTTLWLLCPYLVKRISNWEAKGGVKECEALLKKSEYRKRLWYLFNHQYILKRLSLISKTKRRFLRIYKRNIYDVLSKTGVGGIRQWNKKLTLKCLHLQVAAFLGLRWHPLGDLFIDRIKIFDCNGLFRECFNL